MHWKTLQVSVHQPLVAVWSEFIRVSSDIVHRHASFSPLPATILQFPNFQRLQRLAWDSNWCRIHANLHNLFTYGTLKHTWGQLVSSSKPKFLGRFQPISSLGSPIWNVWGSFIYHFHQSNLQCYVCLKNKKWSWQWDIFVHLSSNLRA